MADAFTGFVLIGTATGAFTATVIGETLPEILGALAGALAGMLVALGALALQRSPVQLALGSALAILVAALWASILAWLVVLWWERLTGRLPPGVVRR